MRLLRARLGNAGRSLTLAFEDGTEGTLDATLLRVFSPSAEGGTGPSRLLPAGKNEVRILRLENVGRYALRLVFDDGHDSGLYTHEALHRLVHEAPALRAEYEARVARARGGTGTEGVP